MNSSGLKVKICGITRYEDAALAADLGAWGLGFIFADVSPRCCSVDTARDIIRRLDDANFEVETVGVFLNEPAEHVNAVAAQTRLTCAQLHGSESPQECAKVNVRVLKAIQHLDPDEPAALARYPFWLLMDAPREGDTWGGTGRRADWDCAARIAREHPLFLAGSLGEENVVEAIERVQPLGIDLSSSVERAHGIKDHDRLKKLFEVLNRAGHGR